MVRLPAAAGDSIGQPLTDRTAPEVVPPETDASVVLPAIIPFDATVPTRPTGSEMGADAPVGGGVVPDDGAGTGAGVGVVLEGVVPESVPPLSIITPAGFLTVNVVLTEPSALVVFTSVRLEPSAWVVTVVSVVEPSALRTIVGMEDAGSGAAAAPLLGGVFRVTPRAIIRPEMSASVTVVCVEPSGRVINTSVEVEPSDRVVTVVRVELPSASVEILVAMPGRIGTPPRTV